MRVGGFAPCSVAGVMAIGGDDASASAEIVSISASSAHQSSDACSEMSKMSDRMNAQLSDFRLAPS